MRGGPVSGPGADARWGWPGAGAPWLPTGAALVLALLLPTGLRAQAESVRFSGYLEHQFSLVQGPSEWSHTDYDRLRVDLTGRAGRGVSASAAVVWQLYRGRTSVSLAEQLPEDLQGLVPAGLEFSIDDRQFLNHAYVSLRTGPVTVTAGKQYLAWGRGMVFNPTELFRPKLLFDPAYEREGVGALSATVETGVLSDASLVYVPGEGWRESDKVVRARSHLAGFDVSVLAAEVWEEDGAALLLGLPAVLQRRRVAGGDISGEILGLGVWAEGTWSAVGDSSWAELTVGGNTTLPGDVLVTLEALVDARGRTDGDYRLRDWLARAAGDRRTLGRTLVFASLNRSTGDLLNLGLAALANPGDGSAAVLPSLTYSFAENVDIFVQAVLGVGPDGSEFGTGGSAGLIRGRVYF